MDRLIDLFLHICFSLLPLSLEAKGCENAFTYMVDAFLTNEWDGLLLYRCKNSIARGLQKNSSPGQFDDEDKSQDDR
jgi:hypothetical protein